jgi:hypothetical protein
MCQLCPSSQKIFAKNKKLILCYKEQVVGARCQVLGAATLGGRYARS